MIENNDASLIHSYDLCDAHYPARLRLLKNPPVRIWQKGTWNERTPSVAIVGARAASKSNEKKAYQLARSLSQAGVSIISGGALGIDAAAHEGAMEGGVTCAVLGTGVDVVYPKRHASLFEQIYTNGGCLLSSFPEKTDIRKGNFPVRNRLIAALCDAVLLIQSPISSGSRYTAITAKELGKPRLVMKGAPEVQDLLMDDARAIESAEEILAILGLASVTRSEIVPSIGLAPMEQIKILGPVFQKMYGALLQDPTQGQGLPEISQRTGLPISTCMATLLELELEGHCLRLPGERYVATEYGDR